MKFVGCAYRAYDPRWAFRPLSGEGAAVRGGRFNPIGVPALYLASTIEGMILETSHGFAQRFEPLTVCTYLLDVDDLVDLREPEARSASGVELDELACPWEYDVAEQRRPASWSVAERLRSAGASGLLAPSFARGAHAGMFNIVLWRWGSDLPHKIEVFDPHGRLPSDQTSWR